MRAMIYVAAAVATFALAIPAQARMANAGLSKAAPLIAQDAHYTGYRHSHYRHRTRRFRHCWNERVRVRTPAGYIVVRTHRRCAWRYW